MEEVKVNIIDEIPNEEEIRKAIKECDYIRHQELPV
jgi:hypothetical protein